MASMFNSVRTNRPVLSTVLLNWNRADLLEGTLDSYLSTTRLPYELFVIDNASSDASRSVIRRLTRGRSNVVTRYQCFNRGGRVLNGGFRRATGRYLHVSANDLEYLPGWDEEMVDKLDSFPEVGQISLFSAYYQVGRGEIWYNHPATRWARGGRTVFLAGGAVPTCSVFRREIFDAGVRWESLDAGSIKLPNNFAFSAGVRKMGYQIAWNDRYVVRNLGHAVEEIASRPQYYVRLYDAKRFLEPIGLEQQLEAHGYRLVEAGTTIPSVQPVQPPPVIPDGSALISARWLARHAGTDYWSHVYDDGHRIYKQATRDLAARESHFLERLSGPLFPRVFEAVNYGHQSVVVLERIRGQPVVEAAETLRADRSRLHTFVGSCLDILIRLRAQRIEHRDIRADNILVREGKPVLIDFGWATSPEAPYFTPDGLGAEGRPPDGTCCDVYALGRVLEMVVSDTDERLGMLVELMVEPASELRITDAGLLRAIFESLTAEDGNGKGLAPPASDASSSIVSRNSGDADRMIEELVRQISMRTHRFRELTSGSARTGVKRGPHEPAASA